MHRRKTSKETSENEESATAEIETGVPAQQDTSPGPGTNGSGVYDSGPRGPSSPTQPHVSVRAPSAGTPPSAPSSRQAFGNLVPPAMNRHSRAPSVYEPLYGNPPSAPPTKQSFSPTSPTGQPPPSPWRSAFPPASPSTSPQSQTGSRRGHGRVHSRNLSVYFPRPGQASGTGVAPIAEDTDGQEIEYTANGDAPIQLIPAPNGTQSRGLNNGFKFGGLPMDADTPSASGGGKRRGHHHKHSLSHNFFSFMEPGLSSQSAPSPIPESPWAPLTPFPQTATTTSALTPSASLVPDAPRRAHSPLHAPRSGTVGYLQDLPPGSKRALVFGFVEFILGGMVWVAGQRRGSLACAGLGYWVVFDAMGVGMGVVGRELALGGAMGETVTRPFGSVRLETTLMFSQAVYLMFAAVYTCKETVEHMLLAAGSSHHHHSGDEEAYTPEGLLFPNVLLLLSAACMLFTAIAFTTHERLVAATGPDLPTLTSLFSQFRSSPPRSSEKPRSQSPYDNRSQWIKILDNPFCAAPVGFALTLLGVSLFISSTEHRSLDLALAGIETLITWTIAYPVAVSLGKVLLQTAPAGLDGLDRVARELERHPHISRPPVPKVWQLTPGSALVATMELPIRRGVDDTEVLALTRYAYERCVAVVGRGGGPGGVSVSVTRE
ncbi:Zinc transporter 6 OS=Danio rerio GN=slc30a6 PE=2 SV=1 [Rhizoctonia solani AG-1 IB]|uniref:Zinc transporter 6 n=1 Tax=Thanatephorus cucumeris (strain AG1-IB / isolate 7/3/14) TaxID=1108050 RepID=A0A0B7FD66_THACB|nr:Zinc transporter 6 OS=Danio rerio GN=slc30a6 PE=2 SV=1 [Rhizoctonia solani AG-1 IB]